MSSLIPSTPQQLLGVAPKAKPPAKPTPPLKAPADKPKAQPLDPPHPVLQAAGYQHGGIQDFNNRVQQVASAYQAAHGSPPSPGLTLDVVRSNVPPEHYHQLFDPSYDNPRVARLQGAVNQAQKQQPFDAFVTRPDGVVQPRTPFYDLLYQGVGTTAPVEPTQRQFLKRYPMVTMGVLPIPSFTQLEHDLGLLNAPETPQPLHTLGGKPVESQQTAQSEAIYEFQRSTGAINQFRQVTTIKQAQNELNKAMGTNLPVTGEFNQTWQSALQNWMKTTDYARQTLKYQADQVGLSVNDYVKAWKAKQKASSRGLTGWFMRAMPIQLFGGGAGVEAFLKGNSSNPLNIGLHSLTASAGLGLDVIGGSVTQAKADLVAGSQLVSEIGKVSGGRETFDQALVKARARLHENPSWLRILMPGFAGPGSPHWEQTVNNLTNVAGDLILLRKPTLTGEVVAPGDIAAATKSAYVDAASNWAYKDLAAYGRDGIGRASARLESTPGARSLVARTAKLVQRGDMTPEQFKQHVAELVAYGRTVIRVKIPPPGERFPVEPPVEPPNVDMTKAPWYGKKPGEEFSFTGGNGEKQTGFLDSKGVPRNSDGKELFSKWHPYPANKISEGLKKELGSGEYEYTGPLSERDMADLYPEDSKIIGPSFREIEINGGVLKTLYTKNLPTPGVPGRAWLQIKSAIRDRIDKFDVAATANNDHQLAQSFVSSIRTAVQHYVPTRLGYMDEILPERVFNFVLKHKLGDAGLANRLESQLVRFQGTENIRGIQQVQRKLEQLYHERNPIVNQAPGDDPFKGLLSTEAPSVFRFPGGGEQELDNGLKAVEGNARRVNRTLNRLAQLHGKIILSGLNPLTGLGGFSLFWKHAVGDSLRVEAGGGGILTGLSPDVIRAKREIDALANADPEMSRILGSYMDREVKSEAHYNLAKGGNTLSRDFRTGEKFGQTNYMTAAGGYVRRMMDDPALQAYQQGGDALTQLVLRDKTYRGMWKAARQGNKSLTAEDYAAMIAERYKNLEGSLAAQGENLDSLKSFYNSVRGAKADQSLGKWIKDNKIDFDVYKGQVEQLGKFDAFMGKYIGNVVMRPNKFNRGRFAHNVLAQTYADLTKAGWDQKTALQTAASVGGELTKYHMLDFANRLQVEQDLRWVSYFATKHRLYWKWVIGTFARHPGYAAAVYDFKNLLDQHGGVALPFKMFGTQWDVPLERLVWVPGREYDETSPLGLAVLNFIKSGGSLDAVVKGAAGTNGNVVTRSDTATMIGTKLLKMETGGMAPSYGDATAGLDKTTASRINRALNEYQITYEREHGHYDTEANAVKKVLLAQLGEEYWRANLPLPIVPEQGRNNEQTLQAEFMSLTDPRARSKFLQQHKGFSDTFGIYSDPKTYLHNRLFFERWTKAIDAYRAARTHLYETARQTGKWTTDLEVQRRELNTKLNEVRNQLLIEDAKDSGINTGGLVPDGQTVPFGVWGKVVNKDPLFDTSHALNTLFPKLHSVSGQDTIGPLQRAMQQELGRLNDPKYVQQSGMTPQEVKTRKVELLQKLEVFTSYPSDALGAVRDTYQNKYVNAYWKGYNQRYDAIQNMPSNQRKAGDAAFRAWRDNQDHPVTVNGIQFPSPARMAWATLDPKTRQQRLAYLSSKPLSDLANYELDLLGVQHPPYVSAAISAITEAVTQARQNGQSVNKQQLLAIAKQVDKAPGYQGFYAFYVNTLTEPRVRQFEATSVFQDMPADARQSWAQISTAAKGFAQAIKANGNSNYYMSKWRKVVQDTIQPWLDNPDNKALKQYLAPMGPNFLNELPTTPTVS